MRAAAALPTRHTFVAAVAPDNAAVAQHLPASVETVVLPVPTGAIGRALALQRLLPQAVRDHRIDVLLNRGNFYVARPGCHQVCLIENANACSHPSIEWPLGMRLRFGVLAMMTRMALQRADHIVFPSHDTAAGMAARGHLRAPWTVVPHGVRVREITAPRPAGVPGPFILSVTSMLPHKNLDRLAAAFGRLVATGYEGHLVLVGFAASAAALARVRAGVGGPGADRVLMRPAMPAAELEPWYVHADLLAMPSLEETFGLPALEAMAWGCPCVVSDLTGADTRKPFFSPFREICGNAAEYCDPRDPESIAGAMARALDPARREALVGAGRVRARDYSWTRTAALMDEVLDRAGTSAASGRRPHGARP